MGIYVDKTIYNSRPSEQRTEAETRTYDFLDSLGVQYQRVDHAHADTIEDCAEIEKIIGVHICKNLFLCNRQETEFYLLMMPGDKPFRTSVVSKIIGTSRLSFAAPEFMLEYLGLTPGSVSVLGLANDSEKKVRLLIDRDVVSSDYIRCHPCVNTSTLKIRTADLLNVILPSTGHEPRIIDIPQQTEEV